MGFLIRCALSAIACCLWTVPILAQQGSPAGADRKPAPDVIIRKMDKNNDGRLSADEFLGSSQRFQFMDADKDGYLTEEELAAALAKQRQAGGAGNSSGQAARNPRAAWYAKLPVILTHTHFRPETGFGSTSGRDWPGTEQDMLAVMDRNGVRATIVMPTPRGPNSGEPDYEFVDSLLGMAKRHPDRVRVSGGGWTLNVEINSLGAKNVSESDRRRFTERADEIIAKGAIGFGETAALHFSMFHGHPFEEVQPDHPLYLLLADLAAKHDVPLDIHMSAVTAKTWTVPEAMRETSNINPRQVRENITAFERLLAHNPKARIIWVHLGMDTTGQRSPELTRRLLAAHANLYISITQNQQGSEVYPLLIPGSGLNPQWRDVITAYPDRFMIGSDAFYVPEAGSLKIGQNLPAALRIVRLPFLPPAIARKVAFENAQRVYRLNLIRTEDVPLPAGGGSRGDTEARPVARKKPAEADYLSETDIRHTVIGNTIRYRALNTGREVFAYFAEDGTVAVRVVGGPDKVLEKSWFFRDGGTLCRTVGQKNRDHCVRVKAGPGKETYEFVLHQKQYQVTVLPGQQMPE